MLKQQCCVCVCLFVAGLHSSACPCQGLGEPLVNRCVYLRVIVCVCVCVCHQGKPRLSAPEFS